MHVSLMGKIRNTWTMVKESLKQCIQKAHLITWFGYTSCSSLLIYRGYLVWCISAYFEIFICNTSPHSLTFKSDVFPQAYLAYGIPRSDLKFFALLQKVITLNQEKKIFVWMHGSYKKHWVKLYSITQIYCRVISQWNNVVLFLSEQAAYTVGGHSFNAATIEFCLLKSKSTAHRPQLVSTPKLCAAA